MRNRTINNSPKIAKIETLIRSVHHVLARVIFVFTFIGILSFRFQKSAQVAGASGHWWNVVNAARVCQPASQQVLVPGQWFLSSSFKQVSFPHAPRVCCIFSPCNFRVGFPTQQNSHVEATWPQLVPKCSQKTSP